MRISEGIRTLQEHPPCSPGLAQAPFLPLRREEGGGEDGVSLGAATTDLWVREGWWLVVKPVAHCASSKQGWICSNHFQMILENFTWRCNVQTQKSDLN